MLRSTAIKLAREACSNYQRQSQQLKALSLELDQDAKRMMAKAQSQCAILAGKLLARTSYNLQITADNTGAHTLLEVEKNLSQQRNAHQNRIATIQALDRYRDRDALLHPSEGHLVLAIEEASQKEKAARNAMARFEFDAFQWMHQRGCHLPPKQSGFHTFLRTITLSDMREKRYFEKVKLTLGVDKPFTAIAEDYQQCQSQWQQSHERLEHYQYLKLQLQDEIQEVSTLQTWVDQYEQHLADAAEKALVEFFKKSDLIAIHARLPPDLRSTAAQAHALTHKARYLTHCEVLLSNEAKDRSNRIISIERVLKKWRRSSRTFLGNKNHWLQAVPEIKRKATQKRLAWCATIQSNLQNYRQYHQYSNLMLTLGADFLAWDAFGVDAPEPMPYEGFTRGVIPELERYRKTHRMTRPNRSLLRKGLRRPFAFKGWHYGYAAAGFAHYQERWDEDCWYDGENQEDDIDGAVEALAVAAVVDDMVEDLS